jgi:hypothetical protein
VFGEFTSVNYNGCSVVGYITATPNLYSTVLSYCALDLTKFSDHKPSLCKINMKNCIVDPEDLLEEMEDVPKRYKRDDEDESFHYQFLAIQNQPDYKDRISKVASEQC